MDRQTKSNRILAMAAFVFLTMGWASHPCAEIYRFVDVEAYPIGFYGQDQKPTGIAVDIFMHVMNQLSHKVNLELNIPGKRVLFMLKAGMAAGIPFIRKTENRTKFLYFSKEPVYTEQVLLFTLRGEDFEFDGNLNKLKHKRIGVRMGDSYGQTFQKIKPELDIYEVETVDQLFKMLLLKRIDIVVSTKIRASWILNRINPKKNIAVVPKPLETIPLYVAFKKEPKFQLLKQQFDQKFAEAKQNGRVGQIVSDWETRLGVMGMGHSSSE